MPIVPRDVVSSIRSLLSIHDRDAKKLPLGYAKTPAELEGYIVSQFELQRVAAKIACAALKLDAPKVGSVAELRALADVLEEAILMAEEPEPPKGAA